MREARRGGKDKKKQAGWKEAMGEGYKEWVEIEGGSYRLARKEKSKWGGKEGGTGGTVKMGL